MRRARWLVSLSLFSLATTPGCGWSPAALMANQPGFSLLVSAPEKYRGTNALTMHFNMPQGGQVSVSAVSSDIEKIDVTLTEPIDISTPPAMPTQPTDEPVKDPLPSDAPDAATPPSDLEQWPTILPGEPNPSTPATEPPSGEPKPDLPVKEPYPTDVDSLPPDGSVTPPGPKPIPIAEPMPTDMVKTLEASAPAITQTTVTRTDLDKGQGSVTFGALKAGAYGLRLVAYDKKGKALGRFIQAVKILEGRASDVDATLILDGSTRYGNLRVGVTIVDGAPGAAGSNVATASPVTTGPAIYKNRGQEKKAEKAAEKAERKAARQ